MLEKKKKKKQQILVRCAHIHAKSKNIWANIYNLTKMCIQISLLYIEMWTDYMKQNNSWWVHIHSEQVPCSYLCVCA